LTRVPAHRTANRRVALAEFAALREFASIIQCDLTPNDRIALLQRFLSERLEASSIHPVVARAQAEIHAQLGCTSVANVAVHCNVSDRHLNRLMRDWIGYGPKRYAAVVRFQHSLAQMERAPRSSAASIATESGYFDQSHMSADVARYAGATPGNLMTESVSDFSKTHCDVPF
jgi:transcriptional regulator GlxA family with amidase domain